MTPLERRHQLQEQIAQLPDDQLDQLEQYLEFLAFQAANSSQTESNQSSSTGASILEALEQAHTQPSDEPLAQPAQDLAAKIAEIRQRGDRAASVIQRGSTGQSLLKYAGTWQGDDLEECLAFVPATRSEAKF